MKSFSSRLIPVAIASILCGVAVAGGGNDDPKTMMDSNSDGKITAAEHAQGAQQMYSKMDADKDGQVTAAEMDTMRASMTKGHGDSNEDQQAGKTKPKQMSSEQKIAKMDTNNDEQLSAAEYSAGAKQMFTKMDTDEDGALTAQEVRDGQRSMMASDE